MARNKHRQAPTRTHAPKGTITLGIPSRGVCDAHFTRTLAELVMWDRDYGRRHLHPDQPFISVIGSTQIIHSRNTIVAKFLAQVDGADWLAFFDDDQVYPKNILEILTEAADAAERRIVGVPVWRFNSRNEGPVEVTHNVFDFDASGVFVDWPDALPDDTVLQVAAIGTGCMMIHRSVLEQMQQASVEAGTGSRWCWFRHVVYQPADFAEGEDLNFCRQAWGLGIPVWAVTTVTLGHRKTITLEGALPEGAVTI